MSRGYSHICAGSHRCVHDTHPHLGRESVVTGWAHTGPGLQHQADGAGTQDLVRPPLLPQTQAVPIFQGGHTPTGRATKGKLSLDQCNLHTVAHHPKGRASPGTEKGTMRVLRRSFRTKDGLKARRVPFSLSVKWQPPFWLLALPVCWECAPSSWCSFQEGFLEFLW